MKVKKVIKIIKNEKNGKECVAKTLLHYWRSKNFYKRPEYVRQQMEL